MNKIAAAFFLIFVAAQSCKPRNRSSVRSAGSEDLVAALAEISRVESDYLQAGRPLLGDDQETKSTRANFLTAPPPGCDSEIWSADLRWQSEAFDDLQPFLSSANVKIAVAAERVAYQIAGRMKLSCSEEFVASRLALFMQRNSGICNDFISCGQAVDLLEAALQFAPEKPEILSGIKNIEDLSACLAETSEHGLNSYPITVFRLKSARMHSRFLAASGVLNTELEGIPHQIPDQEIRAIQAMATDIRKYAFNELFVVNQLGSTYGVNPEYVKRVIVEDMLGSEEAFKKLDENLQTLVITQALSFFEAAWSLQAKNSGMLIYLERFQGVHARNPAPWLAKLMKAVTAWHSDNAGFSFQTSAGPARTFNLDPSQWEWADSLTPQIAFEALTLFAEREAKLPSRGSWGQALSRIYEFIPVGERSTKLVSKYVASRETILRYRQAIKESLTKAGVSGKADEPSSSADTSKAEGSGKDFSEQELPAVLTSLLDGEEEVARKFPEFDSVFSELIQLNTKLLHRQSVAAFVVNKMEAKSEPAEEEKERLITEFDTATSETLAKWMRILCIQRLSLGGGAPTKLENMPFFLDNSIKINFDCKSPTTGDNSFSLPLLDKRVGMYASGNTYVKGWDRAAAKLKEAVAFRVMLVAGLPAGFGGHLAAGAAASLLERVAVSSALSILKKKMIQRIIVGSIDTYVNYAIFGGIMSFADTAMNHVFGVSQREVPPETWGQYLYHQATGLAIFAGVRYVDGFASILSKRINGLGAKARTQQIIQLEKALEPSLKQSFKQKSLDFTVRTLSDTAYFYGTGELSEFVATDVLSLYGPMTTEQRAFQKLYAKSQGQKISEAFAMSLAFRTMGLIHSAEAMPSSPQFEAKVESVRFELTEKMTPEMAYRILELPVGAGDAAVSSAKKKLSRKTHPDTYIPELLNRFRQVVPGMTAEQEQIVSQGVSQKVKFADILVRIKADLRFPQGAKETLGAEYENSVVLYQKNKMITEAAAILNGKK